jgi:hypothetical protein
MKAWSIIGLLHYGAPSYYYGARSYYGAPYYYGARSYYGGPSFYFGFGRRYWW